MTRKYQNFIGQILGIGLVLAGFGVQPAHAAASGATQVEVENPIFGYTHLLPTPYTIPGGKLVIGTELQLGVTDFMQLGTNLVRDAFQIYNANLKLGILDSQMLAFALTLGFEHYNPSTLSNLNPDVAITSWQPGLVVATEVLPGLAWINGGSLAFYKTSVSFSGLERSGYFRGAGVNSELAWAYYKPSKRKGLGNVVALGASYDLNYKLLGLGISHHWPGFRLGVHYFVNAERNQLLPLINGGAVVYF